MSGTSDSEAVNNYDKRDNSPRANVNIESAEDIDGKRDCSASPVEDVDDDISAIDEVHDETVSVNEDQHEQIESSLATLGRSIASMNDNKEDQYTMRVQIQGLEADLLETRNVFDSKFEYLYGRYAYQQDENTEIWKISLCHCKELNRLNDLFKAQQQQLEDCKNVFFEQQQVISQHKKVIAAQQQQIAGYGNRFANHQQRLEQLTKLFLSQQKQLEWHATLNEAQQMEIDSIKSDQEWNLKKLAAELDLLKSKNTLMRE